jgi:hypothetical protein
MVVSFNKVFNQRWRADGYIRKGDMAGDLCLGDEGLQDLVFFMAGLVAIEVEEVVDTNCMC